MRENDRNPIINQNNNILYNNFNNYPLNKNNNNLNNKNFGELIVIYIKIKILRMKKIEN